MFGVELVESSFLFLTADEYLVNAWQREGGHSFPLGNSPGKQGERASNR
jgi:hypothetical protein